MTFTFTENQKRAFRKYVAQVNRNNVDWLKYRENISKCITERAEDGWIGLVFSGKDCDGFSYVHTYVVDAITVNVIRFVTHKQKHADSPMSVQIVKPSQRYVD